MVSSNFPTVFPALDAVIARIKQHPVEPKFSTEVLKREKNCAGDLACETKIFAGICEVIAYSNGSQSALVEQIIANGALARALCDFDVYAVAKLNPCDLVDAHWKTIGPALRRKTKLFQLVLAARAIVGAGGLAPVFKKANLPRALKTDSDIDQFWRGLALFQAEMGRLDIPYLKALTSLLHFLLHVGYDCAKPDSAVMGVSRQLGIARGRTKREEEQDLENTVRVIQEYGLSRGIRPSVVDFYMLIEGGQTWARSHVHYSYYCPPGAPQAL